MAPLLTDGERLQIRIALEDLNTGRVSRGKAELEQVFRSRSAPKTRTARHMYSGLRLEIDSATHARGTSVCMTFGQYGEPPLSPAIPTLVADFVDEYVRGDDGKWRFKERHIHRIFVAPDNSGPLGATRDGP
jgi:hypothetical protein